MVNISTLLFGVLVVAAVLVITSALVALAPYIAGGIVIVGLCWLTFRYYADVELVPPREEPPTTTKEHPRE